MTDFGNPEEREAANRVAIACRELNDALCHADYVGVNCKIIDLQEDRDVRSVLQIERMERRVMILPTIEGT